MNQEILPGRYRHYKGGEYEVMEIAIHSETDELYVVYRPLYGERKLWIRPLDNFREKVEVDGNFVDRFSLIK